MQSNLLVLDYLKELIISLDRLLAGSQVASGYPTHSLFCYPQSDRVYRPDERYSVSCHRSVENYFPFAVGGT